MLSAPPNLGGAFCYARTMPNILSVQNFGNQCAVNMDDGTQVICYPTGGYLWLATPQAAVEPPIDPPVDPPTGDGSLFNPWAGIAISSGGDWQTHVNNTTRGGTDYPFGYGTDIPAPGAGNLRVTGGSGENAASDSNAGGAGRRTILDLDVAAPRVQAKGNNEGDGPMVSIVFQHLSYQVSGRVAKGGSCGKTGASAYGSDYGGDVHLHVHGLNAAGERVDYLKFF